MLKSNKVYLRVTLITISVILINQCFIQYWLYQKRADAKILNISGRQRMISQRIISLSYALNNKAKDVTQKSIERLYDQWLEAHHFLIEQYTPHRFSSADEQDIHQRLHALTPHIQAVKGYIDSPQRLGVLEFNKFRINQDIFLQNMNAIVFDLEKIAYWKLRVVIGIEIIFALISLFMIYFEITFVFKKINTDLINKNQSLEDSNLALEQYAYLAAHDLRSPTQNIINFSKLLQNRLASKMGSQEKKFFRFIIDAANRMKETTDELLKFSSISHEQISIERCIPQQILKNVVNDLQINIAEKNAQIDISPLPIEIKADRQLLHLVFQNLIANGIKFVPKDTTPNINIRYKADDKHHIFSIQDNGIGIDSSNQEKIFGLFKRLHSREDYKGTGIGLSICQKIVEKHHGSIHVESESIQGSTFSFSISKTLESV